MNITARRTMWDFIGIPQETDLREVQTSVTTAQTQLLRVNARRARWTFFNTGSGLVRLFMTSGQTAPFGYVLVPFTGLSANWFEDGDLVTQNWFATSDSGTNLVYVIDALFLGDVPFRAQDPQVGGQ